MPPKVKVGKDEIVNTTLHLVQQNGTNAINARSIATALGCSTQPIFSNFESMEELHQAVLTAAYNLYASTIKKEVASGKYPPYKAFGMAYIRFAQEETELFKLLFMRERQDEDLVPTTDFHTSVDMIMKANNITKEQATRIHLEMWTCVHGIGTMIATSFFSPDWELISDMLTDIYQGLRARHTNAQKT